MIEEGQVKQVLEDNEALAARLHRSPTVRRGCPDPA